MEKYAELINQTLDLLDIIDEGLTHIHKQLTELRLEESLVLLQDTAEALESIHSAIHPLMDEVPDSNALEVKASNMMKSFSLLVNEYEEKNIQRATDTLDLSLEPHFRLWKKELERQLAPLIAS